MIKKILNVWRFPIVLLCFLCMYSNNRQKLEQDIQRYYFCRGGGKYLVLSMYSLLIEDPAFRSVVQFRLNKNMVLKMLFRLFWSPLNTIELNSISGEIAGGLWISHNFMVVSVYSAGSNFRVGPGVVIGLKKDQNKEIINPIIGNDVYICANSTVVGGITIGDNVVVAPGSVVINDIPSNVTVAGNPAKIIRNRESDYMHL